MVIAFSAITLFLVSSSSYLSMSANLSLVVVAVLMEELLADPLVIVSPAFLRLLTLECLLICDGALEILGDLETWL